MWIQIRENFYNTSRVTCVVLDQDVLAVFENDGGEDAEAIDSGHESDVFVLTDEMFVNTVQNWKNNQRDKKALALKEGQRRKVKVVQPTEVFGPDNLPEQKETNHEADAVE